MSEFESPTFETALSSRRQQWVRGREGPPLPQSARPGPRACGYHRHHSFNHNRHATLLPPSSARGPPRSSINAMRTSSLATSFPRIRQAAASALRAGSFRSVHLVLHSAAATGLFRSRSTSLPPPLHSRQRPLSLHSSVRLRLALCRA